MMQEGCRALRERRVSLGATTREVSEARNPRVEKTRDPLVDKASADPHQVSNVGDGHALSHE